MCPRRLLPSLRGRPGRAVACSQPPVTSPHGSPALVSPGRVGAGTDSRETGNACGRGRLLEPRALSRLPPRRLPPAARQAGTGFRWKWMKLVGGGGSVAGHEGSPRVRGWSQVLGQVTEDAAVFPASAGVVLG